jgi:hypothetical protein
MKLELQDPESELLHLMLIKELEETRVEMRHARNMDYKADLAKRESLLRGLIERMGALAPGPR